MSAVHANRIPESSAQLALTLLDPPLKWAGGKRLLVPVLQRLYGPYRDRRLVEPFVGGMAVALGLMPRSALLNDSNPHLVNFLRQLKSGFVAREEVAYEEEFYYAARARFNRMIDSGEHASSKAAELFYYLNRSCFNGLCRFNGSGKFNVPFGRHSGVTFRRDFRAYSPVLGNWEITSGDFESMKREDGKLERPMPDDFIYCDPPFDTEFTRYSAEDFRWDDQVRLARWLSLHPGPVAASNQATPRVLELYSDYGFRIETFDAPRRISCNGDRTPAKEILATRNLAVQGAI